MKKTMALALFFLTSVVLSARASDDCPEAHAYDAEVERAQAYDRQMSEEVMSIPTDAANSDRMQAAMEKAKEAHKIAFDLTGKRNDAYRACAERRMKSLGLKSAYTQ